MMRFYCILTTIFLAFLAVPSFAQNNVQVCIPISGGGCNPVTSANPLPVTDGGGSIVTVGPYTFTPLGCQQLTSLGSSAGWSSVPVGATLVSLTVETQSVRMRDDGTAPTASVGLLLSTGGPWPYSGSLSAMRFIQTATTAVIDGCFYK